MKVLIIEDERPAAKRLAKLVKQFRPAVDILEMIDSVENAVEWLDTYKKPDLIFMDVQLADGVSFEIFGQTEVTSPIIFTTAYDEYALQAFKVNSLDYLLKPIDPEELEKALCQYDDYYQNQRKTVDNSSIEQLLQSLTKREYKERFLVKIGQQLTYLKVQDIAYFYSEDGLIFACQHSGKRHHLDYTLDQLGEILDPADFFRINRKIITQLPSIKKINTYFNSRLKLELAPTTELETIVSRDRVGDFKRWLDK
ncbi:MAG: LytTR family DNA-binding domain-containing protein [Bacteroidota bacterium]